MESFFLSETAKYLYLLHSNASTLPDFYIFSTEGHILPVLPSEEPNDHNLDSQPEEGISQHGNCGELCRTHSRAEMLQVRLALSISGGCVKILSRHRTSCSLLPRPIPTKDGRRS